MIFGPMPLDEAEGAVLAHSLTLEDGPLRKGTRLDAAVLDRLRAGGVDEVIAARLEPGDLSENDAALEIGLRLDAPGLKRAAPFTGRVNLEAEMAGVVTVNAAAVSAMNAIDEGLTLATLPDMTRVDAGQLVATVKVIPYGLSGAVVAEGAAVLGEGALALHPFRGGRAMLVMTRTPGFRDALLVKGEEAVRARVEALGYELAEVRTVAHEEKAIVEALTGEADLILILGASATSDRADVAPAAVVRAGGTIERFGMPVDPGNLLFLGRLRNAAVVGLPGCARSPALNGVDWVMERLAAGLPVDGAGIAAMGVGGLLKEMPGRPQPRQPKR